MTTIHIPITPLGKPRQTQSDRWRQRPAVLRYRQFCDDLREQLPGYVLPGCLRLTFFMPMPPSWSKKKRMAMLGAPHTQKPDVDNLCKSFMDAFKTDDSHVYELHAEKYWAEEGSIELEVSDAQVAVSAESDNGSAF